MGFIDYLILLGEIAFAIVVLGLAVGAAGFLIRRRWHAAAAHCDECMLRAKASGETRAEAVASLMRGEAK